MHLNRYDISLKITNPLLDIHFENGKEGVVIHPYLWQASGYREI